VSNTAALLSVRHLNKAFAGVRAVQDFTLDVEPGEVVGLIGPNGAGKSTIINLVSGFLRPDSGTVVFRGSEITGRDPDRIARLGMVRTFQHIRLFPSLTVRENVEAAAQSRSAVSLVDALLRTPRYRDAMQTMERKADALLRLFEVTEVDGQLAGTLPYGHQRRVEIVRALATEPALLLLDEPAAGMNDVEAAALADFLAEVARRQGLAVVLVEHHLDVVMRLCRRVVVLDHGATLAAGTPEEITRHPEVVRAYLGELV
jgi:ABC-type branched-subunit amino acid transport system ATPase component